MKYGDYENHESVIALHKVGKSTADIFQISRKIVEASFPREVRPPSVRTLAAVKAMVAEILSASNQ